MYYMKYTSVSNFYFLIIMSYYHEIFYLEYILIIFLNITCHYSF